MPPPDSRQFHHAGGNLYFDIQEQKAVRRNIFLRYYIMSSDAHKRFADKGSAGHQPVGEHGMGADNSSAGATSQKGGQGSARKARGMHHDASGSQVGGGLGMALLPFGMVALDRWAAKGKKTRKSKRRYRGGNGCTGGPEQGSSVGAAQGGSRRRRRRRRRQKGGGDCPYAAKGGGRRGKSHRGRRSRRVRSRRTRHRRR